MAIGKKVQDSINDQINWELYSSYIYLSMSADFSSKSLNGIATWMMSQAQEEVVHAMKFYNYLIERGGKVKLKAIPDVNTTWETPIAAFEQALEHEEGVTKRINDMVNLSVEEKDHATYNMLQWFVDEQVEEEASVGEVVDKLKMISDNPMGVYMLDKELGARMLKFQMPQPADGQ